ncbi:MAG TPA: protein kinase [Polyangia bacterium]
MSSTEASDCLDDERLLAFAQGALSSTEVETIDEHADQCEACRRLLDEAVRALRGSDDHVTLLGDVAAGAAPQRLRVGLVLGGRYRIVRFLARGGMGEVYEAHDLRLGEPVALKTVNAELADNPMALRRLKREVPLARRITHANVCRIFDLEFHELPNGAPIWFLTMELIRGETLRQRLNRTGRITPAEALPIVEAIVAALATAHAAGIVHRDLKSENVMTTAPLEGNPGRVVVMDFGLARASAAAGLQSSLSSSDNPSLVGTLAYMAPEQLRGELCLPQTDIYALGTVMFEMVTGHLPFEGASPLHAAWRRLQEPAPTPRKHTPDLDPVWESVILRCLATVPGERFATVTEVVDALRASKPAPKLRGGRKHQRWARAVPATVMVLGATMALWWLVRSLNEATVVAGPLPPSPRADATSSKTPAPSPKTPAATASLATPAQVLPGPSEIPAAPATVSPALVNAVTMSRRSSRGRIAAAVDASAGTTDRADAGAIDGPREEVGTPAPPSRWLKDPEDGFIVR